MEIPGTLPSQGAVHTLAGVRLYMDACCLNRPFDDLTQIRVRLEAEAVLAILEKVEAGIWTLLSSKVLVFELVQMSDYVRRNQTLKFLSFARERLPVGQAERVRAMTLRRNLALGEFDALHLACAERLRADVFLTTDDRLLRAIERASGHPLSIPVANPLVWLTERSNDY